MFKNEDEFKKIVDRLEIDDKPNPEHKKALFNQMLSLFKEPTQPQQTKIPRTLSWNRIRRTIMKSSIMKLAAAAVIIIAVLIGIGQFSSSINNSSVAWADVASRITQIDYVHCYYFKSRSNDFRKHFEGWYDYGKLVLRGGAGSTTYDDGQTHQTFKDGRRIAKETSLFAKGLTVFELFSIGLLSDKNEQFNQQTPINVGDDFLIYQFDSPPDESDYLESIFITVGKNSLLPIQIKIYHKDSDYDLILFDYEAPQHPSEFFELPTVQLPNGKGKVLLDGEEVIIDIEGAPGLKTAIVRLHSKDFDDSTEPTFTLDVTFITEEGYKSNTIDFIRLKAGEAKQCGTGAPDSSFDNWPDGKYRNIRFSPLLKPTDKEDTYIVEITCWIKTN
ncbi:MAG: hypothetical protein ACYTE8_08235 [Planctomycetota bacterium]